MEQRICGKLHFPSLRPIRVVSFPGILKQSDQRSVHSKTFSNWLQGSTVHGGPGRWTPFPHAVETNSDGDLPAALWTVYNYESALWHHPDVWINHLWLYVCEQRRVHMLTWHSGESWGTGLTAGRLVFDSTHTTYPPGDKRCFCFHLYTLSCILTISVLF